KKPHLLIPLCHVAICHVSHVQRWQENIHACSRKTRILPFILATKQLCCTLPDSKELRPGAHLEVLSSQTLYNRLQWVINPCRLPNARTELVGCRCAWELYGSPGSAIVTDMCKAAKLKSLGVCARSIGYRGCWLECFAAMMCGCYLRRRLGCCWVSCHDVWWCPTLCKES
ncbi:hypothetical protein HaLaN_24410, partial [Haematococcus lacustris]